RSTMARRRRTSRSRSRSECSPWARTRPTRAASLSSASPRRITRSTTLPSSCSAAARPPARPLPFRPSNTGLAGYDAANTVSESNLVLISLLGGTALLLYGVRLVGEGLQRAAGTRLRHILQTLSGDRFKALLVGAGVTAVLQSSSATTVMLVGFAS